MDFTVLSHAGLRVKHGRSEILCDPWLVGSTYWRSWWNFPPPSNELVQSLKPNLIYLTHVHWDHFAGPSLRLFPKSTLIVIPEEPVGRIRTDLEKMGFKRIIELGWGGRYCLNGDISITAYPFGVFTDSAVIIEAGGVCVLNCNDTKLMGGPLKEVLRRHPKIDFVLRSHSSANSRAVTHIIDSTKLHVDNRDTYIDDFLSFAEATRARVAVPFASNHCHLHPEVERFNSYVVTPFEVLERARTYSKGIDIKIMLTGDTYSTESGFQIADRPEMRNRDQYLRDLQERVRPRVELALQRESIARFDPSDFAKKINKYFRDVPWVVRRYFRAHDILFVLRSGDRVHYMAVNICTLETKVEQHDSVYRHSIRIEAPLLVVNQCLSLGLFSHLAISKRAHYYATSESFFRLRAISLLFNFIEYKYFPIKNILSAKFIFGWLARWRELILYMRIAYDLILRKKKFDYGRYL